ncbi:MAG: dihydropteroate synthase [Anaerolineales bacterium]
MGILNITPDSFPGDGHDSPLPRERGRGEGTSRHSDQAKYFLDNGADIIDIGGESTRQLAACHCQLEEIARVVPIIQTLQEHDITD